MKRILIVLACILPMVSNFPTSNAFSNGSRMVHEVSPDNPPRISLTLTKDPTGGFNVQAKVSNFLWKPDMASMKHKPGEGHAHVYLDGQKIMRIYNEWFHLNTYQFSRRAGKQLLSIELVGNDHAPYVINGEPVGVEQLVTVPQDEIQRSKPNISPILLGTATLLTLSALAIAVELRRRRRHHKDVT